MTKTTAKLKDYFNKKFLSRKLVTAFSKSIIYTGLLSSASVLCFVILRAGSSYPHETLAIISFYDFIAHLVHQQLSPETVF